MTDAERKERQKGYNRKHYELFREEIHEQRRKWGKSPHGKKWLAAYYRRWRAARKAKQLATRPCTQCNKVKPVGEFTKSKQHLCKPCFAAYVRKRRTIRGDELRTKQREHVRRWRKKNPERARQINRESCARYYAKHRDKVLAMQRAYFARKQAEKAGGAS